MEAEIAEFRAEVQGRRGTRSKGAAPYKQEMIARGRALAARLRETGEAPTSVARRLGVAGKTLMKWLGEAETRTPTRGARFVRVGIKAEEKAEKTAGLGGVRLVSPRGYRIEGVDLATALAILREVG